MTKGTEWFNMQGAAQRGSFSDLSPHPWRRFFARTIDLNVNGLVLLLIGTLLLAAVAPAQSAEWYQRIAKAGNLAIGYLVTLLGSLANIPLIGLTGTTLGKWMFGIRVTGQDGRAMGVGLAFKRELAVFLRGYGLGFPIVWFFTMGTAYKKLTRNGITSWDKDYSLLVSHRHNSVVQTLVGGIALAALVAGLFALNMPS